VSTFAGIFTTLPTYKSNTCEVIEGSIDDNKIIHKITTKMTMAIVANGSFIGGGIQPAPKADMLDGLLDTIIVKNSDSFKILNKLVNIKKGVESITNEKDIHYGQSQTVALVSESKSDITVAVDGEPIGILPVFFRTFPQVLKIES
jgi:diacylglycerol kinase (ATP)